MRITLYTNLGFERVGTFPGYFKVDGELVDFEVMVLGIEKIVHSNII